MTNGFLTGVIFLFLCSCDSEYEKLLKKELKSGIVYDSIFLGFNFSHSRKEFFNIGWKQNKKGLIRQGPENKNIEHILKTKEKGKSSIQMLFYPGFDKDDKIKKMDIRFRYLGWSPWNRHLFSDSLLVAVKDTLMSWYGGNEFLLMEYETEPTQIWVKVDGNRRISLSIKDEREVSGVIKDLLNDENSERL